VPEHLKVSPRHHNFGNVTANNQSKPVKITIANVAKGKNKKYKLPVMIEFTEGAANYPVVSNNCPAPPSELGYKQSCVMTVACVPPGVGKVPNGKMLIRDNAPREPQSVTLTCKGK
jgi:hypothetical protein